MNNTVIIFIMNVKISPDTFGSYPGKIVRSQQKLCNRRTTGEKIYQKILISHAVQGCHDSVVPGQLILFRFLKNRRGIRDI